MKNSSVLMKNSSFLLTSAGGWSAGAQAACIAAKFIILSAEFVIFNAEFVMFNAILVMFHAQFIVFDAEFDILDAIFIIFTGISDSINRPAYLKTKRNPQNLAFKTMNSAWKMMNSALKRWILHSDLTEFALTMLAARVNSCRSQQPQIDGVPLAKDLNRTFEVALQDPACCISKSIIFNAEFISFDAALIIFNA